MMHMTSLLAILGGRLEGLPQMKLCVVFSKFLQNSSVIQKISVTLVYIIISGFVIKYLMIRYLNIQLHSLSYIKIKKYERQFTLAKKNVYIIAKCLVYNSGYCNGS